MKKLFIPYEQALELKELGFNEDCLGRYCIITKWEMPTGEIKLQYFVDADLKEKFLVKAPVYQQVFNWFDKHFGLFASFDKVDNTRKLYYDFTVVDSMNREYNDEDLIDSASRKLEWSEFKTYEEARQACLEKLIELCGNL